MPITHTNRRGQTYYLHSKSKPGGGLKYHFSQKSAGSLVDQLPEGYEIYENVEGQVFLRKPQPKLIHDSELALIQGPLQKPRPGRRYLVESRGDTITVHEAQCDASSWADDLPWVSRSQIEATLIKHAHYQAVMRFVLIDEKTRTFAPQRFCFRGSVDDWISIGAPGPLRSLAAKFLKHLGQESIFELF